MTIIIPDIRLAVRPSADGTSLTIEPFASNLDLTSLPGTKHIYLTLTQGGLGQGGDGGTHHEEGYTPRELKKGQTDVTFKKLQEADVDGQKIIRGKVSLALEELAVDLGVSAPGSGALVQVKSLTLAAAHFARIRIEAGRSFVFDRYDPAPSQRELLTVTPQEPVKVNHLCIVKHDGPPGKENAGWQALDEACYSLYVPDFSAPQAFKMEFHLLDSIVGNTAPDQLQVFGLGPFGWLPLSACQPDQPDRIAVCGPDLTSMKPIALMKQDP